ncbi:MAG: polysaccharide deacetylase family protein [Planctomycetaceae bacterium]
MNNAFCGGQERQLIIHADDAGMSHSVNVATIEALETGIVTSASIMVPCPWFSEFAEYAKNHPEYDYGIHLTLNAEWNHYRWGPVTSRDKVPSLIDENGYLWDNVAQVAANVRAEEVETELRAQIDRAKAFGVPLSHLDTHMGALVSRPDLVEVYARLGIDYNLPILFIRKLDDATAAQYPAMKEAADQIVRTLDASGLPVLDSLSQFYGGDTHEQRTASYYESLKNLKPGVSELIIHCGIDNEELRAITNSSARRDGDRRIFTSDEMRSFLSEQKIGLLTWKQFRGQVSEKAAPK